MKTCPILKAGTMTESIMVEKQVAPSTVSTHSITVTRKAAECMGEECEWFDNGCPAHQGLSVVRVKCSE